MCVLSLSFGKGSIMNEAFNDDSLLVPGKWYFCAIQSPDGGIDWTSAPMFQYEGDGVWVGEEGEEASMYDPVMLQWCSPRYADIYHAI